MSKHRPEPLMVESLETRCMFAIHLDIVALHEFGHALGLAHYADTSANSIMEAYYFAGYNKANLASDVCVTPNAGDGYDNLQELFTAAKISNNTTSWKNNLDPTPGNGKIDISYSFIPDGTVLDSNKKSNLFATMRNKIGFDSVWQGALAGELNRWAGVSNNTFQFFLKSDNGAKSGTGAIQNDPNFGDVRIGGHRFDGSGGVLAHCYYPPGTNNNSFAGDAHFASEEAWDLSGQALTAGPIRVGPNTELVRTADGLFFHCLHEDHAHADEVSVKATPTFVFSGSVSEVGSAQAVDQFATVSRPVVIESGSSGLVSQKRQTVVVADDASYTAVATPTTTKSESAKSDRGADVWAAYAVA